MKLTLPYPPSANRLRRIVVSGKRGFMVSTTEAKAYRKLVGQLCVAAGARPIPVPNEVCIVMHVYRPRKRGDLDNTQKAVLDALKGFCYEDDSQIAEQHNYRHDDKHYPRLEIQITPCRFEQTTLNPASS